MSSATEPPKMAPPTEQVVAEKLALCAKACFIYPETNQRVLAGNAELSELLGKLEGDFDFRIRSEDLATANGLLRIEHPVLEWLAGLLRKTLVSRLVVAQTVSSDVLVQFFVTLRGNTAGNNKSSKFVEFWPNLFAGIRLFETRYREGKGDAGWIGGGFDADGDGGSGFEVDDLGPAASKLREFLGDSDWVKTHLSSIEQAFDLITKDDELTADLDLVSVLVKNLPDHLYGDFDSAVDVVRDILNSVEAAVFAMATEETKSDQESLNEVLLRVASEFFRRDDWQALAQEERPKVLGTHKGDEKITDDIAALKEEFAQLPTSEYTVNENNVVEVLNIVLHCLLSGVAHKSWRATYAQLHSLLEDLPTSGISLLESYVREALRLELESLRRVRGELTETAGNLPLFSHFQHAGILELCRRIGVVTPDLMLEFFPAGLGSLVDSIDRRSPEDLTVLDQYLTTIGPDRLLAAEQSLVDTCGLMEEPRIRTILASRGRSSLSFAFLATKRGGVRVRPWIVQYLRGLRLESAESKALWIEPLEAIPPSYLRDLCEFELRRFERPDFRESVGRLLIDHLARLPQLPKNLEQRVRIIHSLASFPSSLTAKALQREVARRGLFRLMRAPAEVREAARQSLARCKREIH